MTAKITSIINMKGGVGKSTTAVTLAETLANHHRRRVLLIDLDPQTNASIMAGGPERWNAARKEDRTLDAYFDAFSIGEKPKPFRSLIDKRVSDLEPAKKQEIALDLIAAAPEFRFVERDIIEKFVKQQLNLDAIQKRICQWFAQGLKTVMEEYDDILIDCPPGISLFAEAALIASDFILVPSIPDYVSRLGLIAFRRRALTMIRDKRGAPSQMFVLATKYDETFSLHRSEASLLKENLGDLMFDIRIPQAVDIARAAEWSETKRSFEQKYGAAAQIVILLGEEFIAKTRAAALAA